MLGHLSFSWHNFNDIGNQHKFIRHVVPDALLVFGNVVLENNKIFMQIKAFYRIGFTWTSNALEGNSLAESETKVLIEDGLTIGGRPLRDMFEAVDHAKAYDYMFTLLGNKEITVDILLK